MSEDKQPRKQAVVPRPDRGGVVGGLSEGLAGFDWEQVQNNLARIGEAIAKTAPPQISEGTGSASASVSAKAEGDALQPQVAGGEPKTKRKKNTAGKTFLHGADRTVRYYKPTEAELDRLSELSKDEMEARQAFGFCAGLVINVILGLIFAAGLSPAQKGVAFGIGLCAALAAYKFWSDAKDKERDGKSALDKVKADHDFANI